MSDNRNMLDVVKCSKLRVYVAQVGDVAEETIEQAGSALSETLRAAVSIHAAALDPMKRYKALISIGIEELTDDAATESEAE